MSTSMTPERWEQVQALLHAALEKQPEERAAYLVEACAGDANLRTEVESLIAAHEDVGVIDNQADDLLPTLAATMGTHDNRAGSRVAQYEIKERLGGGGMGVVYRAHDTRLRRTVALKFLPPYLSADETAKERFTIEAQVAAGIDHPNICTILEIGETENGQLFIAMPFYEGETLKRRIARGPLPIAEAREIATQIANGLSKAHEHGIVHRDIKPANVMITADGMVKIVDFGIAKLADVSLTQTGQTPGTLSYMSPEQARGDRVGHRTDLWSLGVVLYEMLTGERPFRGENSAAVIHAIGHDEPTPLAELRPETPEELVAPVNRLLAKQADERTLEGLADASAISTRPTSRDRSRKSLRRRYSVAALAVLVFLVGLAIPRLLREVRSPESPEGSALAAALPGVAVLPFRVQGEDVEVWREGMVDLLTMGFDQAETLWAISPRTVMARWREHVPVDVEPDVAAALEVASTAGATYAVDGTALQIGPDLQLVANIYDVDSGDRLGRVEAQGSLDSIPSLAERLAVQALLVILKEGEDEIPNVRLAAVTTSSLPALVAFARGEALMRRAQYVGAADAFDEAVAADSTFALAYWRLNVAHANRGAGLSMAREALEQAYRFIDRLGPREALLVRAAVRQPPTSRIAMLLDAVRHYPDDSEMWLLLSEAYYHGGGRAVVGIDEMVAGQERAYELNPTVPENFGHNVNLAASYYGDSTLMAKRIEAYAKLVPDDVAQYDLALDLAFGDPTARKAAIAALDTVELTSFYTFVTALQHPRFWPQREAVLEVSRRRGYALPMVTALLFDGALGDRGHLARAIEYLDRGPTNPVLRACGLYRTRASGLPVPAEKLEEALAPSLVDSTVGGWALCAGAYAADRGRWDEHAAVIAHLEGWADDALTRGDSIPAQRATAAALALEGYAHWKRGRPDEALILMERAIPGADAGLHMMFHAEGPVVRWWLGELSMELGRYRQAARYFNSFWQPNLAHARYHLGRAYEQLGEPEKAREAYEYLITAWVDADADLQIFVQRARESLARLDTARNE